MVSQIHHLSIKWTISRARDSYGYNIVTILDSATGKKFKECGGGYDMTGTAFGNWLSDTFQTELMELKERAYYICSKNSVNTSNIADSIYGMYYNSENNKISLDGGVGLSEMIRLAVMIGLEVQREYVKTGKKRGETIGYFVQMTEDKQGKEIYM